MDRKTLGIILIVISIVTLLVLGIYIITAESGGNISDIFSTAKYPLIQLKISYGIGCTVIPIAYKSCYLMPNSLKIVEKKLISPSTLTFQPLSLPPLELFNYPAKITVYAEFISPSGKKYVRYGQQEASHYDAGTYYTLITFKPNEEGKWTIRVVITESREQKMFEVVDYIDVVCLSC